MKRPPCVGAVLAFLALAAGRAAAAEFSAADVDFFEAKVRPLLDANCFSCHANGKERGGLSLASRESLLKGGDSGRPAVVPGDPDHSPLIVAVRYNDDVKMPKKYRLKDDEIAVLAAWVRRGAPWPAASGGPAIRTAGDVIRPEDRRFWSFRPVADPPAPAVKDPGWCKQSLDRFILAKQEEKGLHPVGPADKRTLIRRATFDLIGLPPTPEEVDAFLADDAPDAFARVVDRLLASPHYGERWARHWLDVARYGEDQAHTFQARLYPYGYRYRDWVIQAFNDDMPYDRFVTEQIAGDLLKTGDPTDRLPALGFFALGPHYYMDAGEVKAAEAAELDDRVDVLGRGFLGLTVACARCHDHKFDPITSQDYYALAGVFKSSRYVETPLAPADVVEKFNQAQEKIKRQEAKVKEFLDAEAKKLGETPKKVEAKLPDDAKKELAALRADLDQLKKSAPPKPPVVHTLADGPGENMHVYLHGNPNNEGPVVPRRFLRILSDGDRKPFTQGSGRLELAQAIASPKNPLTARVIVNRVWQWHFGVGIVPTPSNFGKLGQPPTHPELLDHLATRFMAEGWSIKKLHREIMLSATYQTEQHGRRRRPQDRPGEHALLAHEPPPAGRGIVARRPAVGRRQPRPGRRRPLDRPQRPRQPPPHALRRREPARAEQSAPPVRLPRPQHHGGETAGDDGAAATAVRPQQRLHGRAGAGTGEAAGRREGRRGEGPQGVPAAVRPAGDGARSENGPGFPGRARAGPRAERGEAEAEPLGAVRPGAAGDE